MTFEEWAADHVGSSGTDAHFWAWNGWNAALAASPPQEAQPDEPKVEPDNTCVICPQCCNQFRAIPVQVQHLLLDAGYAPPFMISARQDAWQEARPVPEPMSDSELDEQMHIIHAHPSTVSRNYGRAIERIVVARMQGERK